MILFSHQIAGHYSENGTDGVLPDLVGHFVVSTSPPTLLVSLIFTALPLPSEILNLCNVFRIPSQ